MQSQQSIVKSIIYGSPIQTTYGLFRSLCSAINHRDHIDKIIFYLRNNQNFIKYNKFVYAFRLQQPTNQTFITSQLNNNSLPEKQKYIQGYNDDTNLQGNGQKLLNLLKKFSVRNVLVIVAIRQKDPLKQFNSQHYVQIVKCAKDLLSSLYDKVVLAKDNTQQPIKNQELIYQPLQVKQFDIPLQTFYPKIHGKQNPNYVGRNYIKKLSQKQKVTNKLMIEMKYLNSKIQELANSLEDTIQQFMNIQDSQIQFAILYDKTPIVVKSFGLLAELFGLKNKQEIIIEINKPEYAIMVNSNDNSSNIKEKNSNSKMSNFLRSITMRALTSTNIRKMNQQLLSNKNLKSQKLKKDNQICFRILQFVQILLKSYSFARRLAIMQAQFQGDQEGQKSQQNGQITQYKDTTTNNNVKGINKSNQPTSHRIQKKISKRLQPQQQQQQEIQLDHYQI